MTFDPVGSHRTLLWVTMLALVLCPTSVVSIAKLPGGGTSLFIPHNGGAGVIEDFRGLANVTEFSVEFWVLPMSSTYQPTVFGMLTVDDLEYFSIYVADTLEVTLNMRTEYILENVTGGWHHVAVTVQPGVVTAYLDGQSVAEYPEWPTSPKFPPSTLLIMGKYISSLSGATAPPFTAFVSDDSLDFQGCIDELRIWSTCLTAEMVADRFQTRVPENSVGLVVQWHFDEIDYEDAYSPFVITSAQGFNLSLVDISNLRNDPCGSQLRPAISEMVPNLYHSNHPFILVDYIAGSVVRIPMPFAFVVLSNISVAPENVSQGPHLHLPETNNASGSVVTYFEYHNPWLNFTTDVVEYRALDDNGSDPTVGRIYFRLNSFPIAQSAKFSGGSGKNILIEFPITDLDGDVIEITISRLPRKGKLFQLEYGEAAAEITDAGTLVSNRGGVVVFVAPSGEWGREFAAFDYCIRQLHPFDVEEASGTDGSISCATVTIDVLYVRQRLETLQSNTRLELLEDTPEVEFQLGPLKYEDIVTVGLTSLPRFGDLFVNNIPITALVPASQQKDEWVSQVLSFSSEYYNPPDKYIATQVIGPQAVFTYGDSPLAWTPMSVNFSSFEQQLTYTEFIHVKFPMKLYALGLILVEVDGPYSLVRVRTPDPSDPTKWATLWMGSPSARTDDEILRSVSICHTAFPIDELRLEFDCSFFNTYFELDAIKLVGTLDPPKNLIPSFHKLSYRPRPLKHGIDSFNFTLTDCPGQYLRTTPEFKFVFNITHVNHAPVGAANVSFEAHQSQRVAVPLTGSDVDESSAQLSWILVTGALSGDIFEGLNGSFPLRIGDKVPFEIGLSYVANVPLEDTALRCGPDFSDGFVVQLFDGLVRAASETEVRIDFVFCDQCAPPHVASNDGLCEPCPTGSVFDERLGQCVAVAPSSTATMWWVWVTVAVLAALLVSGISVALLYMYSRRAQALRLLESVPDGQIAFVFTDIQNSTYLWETFPQMALALEIHNKTIRELLAIHGGYEVKTIGDAFFLTFRDVNEAVKFALDVQIQMRLAPWPVALLDLPGCELEMSSTGTMIWCGLRVRIGIHYGFATVEVSPKTLQADYLGSAVNFAARVESKALGGQILISDAVYAKLSDEVKDNSMIQELGMTSLKGIVSMQRLYSILPSLLQERSFPELMAMICNRCRGNVLCPRCDSSPLIQTTSAGGSRKSSVGLRKASHLSGRARSLARLQFDARSQGSSNRPPMSPLSDDEGSTGRHRDRDGSTGSFSRVERNGPSGVGGGHRQSLIGPGSPFRIQTRFPSFRAKVADIKASVVRSPTSASSPSDVFSPKSEGPGAGAAPVLPGIVQPEGGGSGGMSTFSEASPPSSATAGLTTQRTCESRPSRDSEV